MPKNSSTNPIPQCVQPAVTGCLSRVAENVIDTGSDFSGVGAFDQALERLGIKQNKVFACDMDKYARQTYIYNFGEPAYYPENVYDREIPKESLDIYMTSPPCQSFSIAGKRKGEDSKNGVLFYNSHEFIVKNNPRYFIFENVKGLLSDDNGKTFQRWIDYLGGKSVNGNPVIFPHENATPYHVYYQVMNAKHYGVPQNRERIFIIGIRDDEDNNFSFPKPFHLVKRLKDVLESEVDEKYFLSDKMIESITYGNKSNGEVANLNKGGERGSVYSENTDAMSCLSATDYKQPKQIQIGTWRTHEDGRGFRATEDNNCPTIPARAREDGSGQPVIKIGAIRGRNPSNPLSRVSGLPTEQMLEINESGTSNALTTVQKDNVVVIPANNSKGYDIAEEEEDSINFSNPNSETRRGRVGHGVSQTLDTACNQGILTQQRIRRLTPFECFRLMDFNENFKWNVSDSQAYKQGGNSIVVSCLVEIIKRLDLR
jgi:DNA (cytosine-5)-methyltransferase 1